MENQTDMDNDYQQNMYTKKQALPRDISQDVKQERNTKLRLSRQQQLETPTSDNHQPPPNILVSSSQPSRLLERVKHKELQLSSIEQLLLARPCTLNLSLDLICKV